MSGAEPDTAGELTALAGWIAEQLADETADRQWIAESAAAKVRDITLQMLGAAALGHGGAELAARITAATAVLGDFRRADYDYLDHGGARPDYSSWAHRLDVEVVSMVEAAGAQAPALTPQQLAVLGQVLGDAIAHREPGGFCIDCDASPAGLCQDHAEDLDRCDAYGLLAKALGVEL